MNLMRLDEITDKYEFSKFYEERNLINNNEKLQYLIDETGYNPKFNDNIDLIDELDFLEDYVLKVWDKKSYFYFSIKNQEDSPTRKGQLGILNKRLLKINEDFINLRDDILNRNKFDKVFQTKETEEDFDNLLKLTQDQLKSIRLLILQAIANEDKDTFYKCAEMFKNLVDKIYGSQQQPDPEIEKAFANIPDKYKCSGFKDTEDIKREEKIREGIIRNSNFGNTYAIREIKDPIQTEYILFVQNLLRDNTQPLSNATIDKIFDAIVKYLEKFPSVDVLFGNIRIHDTLAIKLMTQIAKLNKKQRSKIKITINNPGQQLLFDFITKKSAALKKYKEDKNNAE